VYVFIGLLISPFLFTYTLLGDSILSQILKTDYKQLQIRFLADSINANYGKLEYLEDGLDEVINQLKKSKK